MSTPTHPPTHPPLIPQLVGTAEQACPKELLFVPREPFTKPFKFLLDMTYGSAPPMGKAGGRAHVLGSCMGVQIIRTILRNLTWPGPGYNNILKNILKTLWDSYFRTFGTCYGWPHCCPAMKYKADTKNKHPLASEE